MNTLIKIAIGFFIYNKYFKKKSNTLITKDFKQKKSIRYYPVDSRNNYA